VRQLTFQWAGGPAIPVLSVAIALLVGAVFVLFSGNDPVKAYVALFQGAFGTPYDITETIVSAIPLVLTGLAVAIAFRTGLFNIGAQGQLLVGALDPQKRRRAHPLRRERAADRDRDRDLLAAADRHCREGTGNDKAHFRYANHGIYSTTIVPTMRG